MVFYLWPYRPRGRVNADRVKSRLNPGHASENLSAQALLLIPPSRLDLHFCCFIGAVMSVAIQNRDDFLSLKSPDTTVNETFQLVPVRPEGGAETSSLALDSTQAEEEAVALPPVDGGLHAWTFIFCSFILECLVWGFPLWCVSTFCNSVNVLT